MSPLVPVCLVHSLLAVVVFKQLALEIAITLSGADRRGSRGCRREVWVEIVLF